MPVATTWSCWRTTRHPGSGSGVPLAGEHGYVWTVRDGQAVRFCWFNSHREALEAAGLA